MQSCLPDLNQTGREEEIMIRKRIAAVLTCVCLMVSGCSSLVMDIDLNKAQVKEIDFGKIYGSRIAGEIMSHGKKKYNIGGTDAFYVLPNGLPEPESILDFQVLDLIDGTTTVYAYQSLYKLDDATGRGGKPKIGKRLEQTAGEEETRENESAISADNILKRDDAGFEAPLSKKEELQAQVRQEESEKEKEESGKAKVWAAEDPGDKDSFDALSVTRMVTVMMKYNTSTGDYQVLYSAVDNVKVEMKTSFGTTSAVVYMEPKSPGILSMGMEEMTVRENNPIFTQIVNGNYFLYHGGKAYLFTKGGIVVYYYDLTQITTLTTDNWSNAKYSSTSYSSDYSTLLPEAAMIDSVFMDSRNYLYVQYSYPRPQGNTAGKSKIDNSTGGKEEQSLDDMEDTTVTTGSGSQSLTGTVTQMAVISRLDVGNAKSTTGRMANSNYFYSDNVNFEKQTERIKGLLDECVLTFSEEPSDEDIDQWMNKQLADFDKDIPTSYGPYTFNSPGSPLQLCFYGYWYDIHNQKEAVLKGNHVSWGESERNKAQLKNSFRYLTDLGVQDEEQAFEYLVNEGYLTPVTAENHERLRYYINNGMWDSENGFLAYMPSQSADIGSRLMFLSQRGSEFGISDQELETEEIQVTLHIRWEDSEKTVTRKIRIPKRYCLYVYGNTTTFMMQTFYPSGRAYPSTDEGYLSVSTEEKTITGLLRFYIGYYRLIPDYIIRLLTEGVSCVNAEQIVDRYAYQDGVIGNNGSVYELDSKETKRTFPVMLNEIPRNAHVVTALRAGETAKKEVILQSDKSLMVFPSDGKTYLVNTSMLLFDIYGDVMNVDFEQPQQGEKEITSSYLSQGLTLYQDSAGTWWLYAANTEKGLLKINLDKCSEFQEELPATSLTGYQSWVIQNTQKIGDQTSYDGSGQISAYPYYCVWLGEDAKDCYAIGFQSMNYTYGAEDLCGAKLYHLSLVDETATVNLAYSSIRKNPAFQKAYAQKDTEACYKSWAGNIELLNLIQNEETQTTLANYYDFLMNAATSKDKAFNAFTAILTKTDKGKSQVTFDESNLRKQLESCRSRQDLESLLAQLRPELAEETSPGTVKDPTESAAEDPFARMAREQEEALKELDERIKSGEFEGTETESSEGQKESSQSAETYGSGELAKQQNDLQFLDSKSKIIDRLKELNGYTDDSKWNDQLDEIADNLHPATIYSEYKLAKKQKETELAAKAAAEQQRILEEERIRAEALKQQAELEKAARELEAKIREAETKAAVDDYSRVAESAAAKKSAAEESRRAESEAASRAVEESIRESEEASKAAEMASKAAEASKALQEREASDEMEEAEKDFGREEYDPAESSPQEGGSDYE